MKVENEAKQQESNRHVLQQKYDRIWKRALVFGWIAAICFALTTGFGEILNYTFTISSFLLITGLGCLIYVSALFYYWKKTNSKINDSKKYKKLRPFLASFGIFSLLSILFFIFSPNLPFPLPLVFFISVIEIIALLGGIHAFLMIEKPKSQNKYVQMGLSRIFGNTDYRLERLRARRDWELLKIGKLFVNNGIKLKPIESMEVTKKLNQPNYYISKETLEKLISFQNQRKKVVDFVEQKNGILNILLSGGNVSTDQIAYHNKKIIENKAEHHFWHSLQKLCLILLITLAVLHFISAICHQMHYEIMFEKNIHHFLIFLSISMTASIGAIEALISFKEFKRNIKNSEYMAAYLEKKKEEIEKLSAADEPTFIELANEIRERLDFENLNWFIINDSISPKAG